MNILVSGEGIVKISDFGNAILRDYSLLFTDTTDIGGGTARWMVSATLLDLPEISINISEGPGATFG